MIGKYLGILRYKTVITIIIATTLCFLSSCSKSENSKTDGNLELQKTDVNISNPITNSEIESNINSTAPESNDNINSENEVISINKGDLFLDAQNAFKSTYNWVNDKFKYELSELENVSGYLKVFSFEVYYVEKSRSAYIETISIGNDGNKTIVVECDNMDYFNSEYVAKGETDDITAHKPHTYSNEFPGDINIATEIELTDDCREFFHDAYSLICQFTRGFDYGDEIWEHTKLISSRDIPLSKIVKTDGTQLTTEELRAEFEKYYSIKRVDELLSFNNSICCEIDGNIYSEELGIPGDITCGDTEAVSLYELDGNTRVIEVHLERFSFLDLSPTECDIIYFKLVDENSKFVFDDIYPITIKL